MMNRTRLNAVAVLLVAGCGSATEPASGPSTEIEKSAGRQEVTFYVAGMNQKLQILWGDWPNKVKQALLELEDVASVEDEWERVPDSLEDLDLLFVTYDPDRVTIEQLIALIEQHGFKAEVKEEEE